ncbi:MAG: thiosulfate oxidation carrier protein SoxY [Proteobacteria bacterium]|nr:thiosulfate oxidation carrier protein SoxY [Pseudomonadota bacterium]
MMVGQAVEPGHFDRRDFLKMTGAGAMVLTMTPFAAEATPEMVTEALAKVLGNKKFKDGRIKITLPEIAENGAAVAMRVAVDGPMTADDHVTAIHMFSEGNPLPYIGSYRLSPRNGKAEISLRIRLAQSQKIVVAAETSKGETFLARQGIKVTLGGCGG